MIAAVHVHLRRLEQADPDRPVALLHHRHPQLLHHQEDHPVKQVQVQDHLQVIFRPVASALSERMRVEFKKDSQAKE